MRAGRVLVTAGGIILIIGAFLPWVSVPVLFGVEGHSYEGIEIGWEGSGIVTSGIGLVLVLGGLFLRRRPKIMYSLAGALLALLAVLVVTGCVRRIFEIGPSAGFFAAVDVGLYVTLVGALMAFTGTLLRAPMMVKAQNDEQGSMASQS